MKNNMALFGIVLLVLIAGFFVFGSNNKENTAVNSGAVQQVQGEVQKVSLSMKDYNYYPNTIRVKSGIPVEITLEKEIYGCLRSFTIPEFKVSKNSRNPDEKIVFTPDKKGTFTFACSMGMGYGKIIVE